MTESPTPPSPSQARPPHAAESSLTDASALQRDSRSGQTPAVPRLPELDLLIGDSAEVVERCRAFRIVFDRLRREIGKIIVGQDEIVRDTLISLFADGHVLLEGVPGLGKTLLVRTLSAALELPFSRIQFTPDLMPADIVGTNIVMEDTGTGRRAIEFRPGPIFAQIILADEINRATPKTQSALLQAMQERCVTVAVTTYKLSEPFLVLATQNPIEHEGTYRLPEAQLDRFLFKLVVPYATRKEMAEILVRTTADSGSKVQPIVDGEHIIQAQRLVRRVVAADHVQDYAIRLALATHPGSDGAPAVTNRYVRVGVSPRGVQALILGAKVLALIEGRYAIAYRDIERVALPALRHRVMVNFEAEAESVSSDEVIEDLLRRIPHEVQLR